MAEINSAQAANVAAGTMNKSADKNRKSMLTVTMPATWSASNGDTVATKQVLPASCRVTGVRVSNAAGASSSTLSVGIRKATDGTSADPDALVNALAITTAAYAGVFTGALLTAGQSAIMPAYETEVYLTFGGANPTANQALRVEIDYVSP